MTNPEIRRAARKKCSGKGLALMMTLAYLPGTASLLHRLYSQVNETSRASDWAVILLAALAMPITEAGAARVSLAVWRGGAARFGDFLAYVRDWRLLLRALAATAWVVLLPYVVAFGFGYLIALIPSYNLAVLALTALSLLILLLNVPLSMLFYAIEIGDRPNLSVELLQGTGRAMRGLWRVIGMNICICWWMALLTTVAAAAFGAVSVWAMLGAAAVVSLACWWFIGGHYQVSCAALALELFAGAGAAAEYLTPEELEAADEKPAWEQPAPPQTDEAPAQEKPAPGASAPRRGEWEDD